MRNIPTVEFDSEMLLSQKKEESLKKAQDESLSTKVVLTDFAPESVEEKMDVEVANPSLSPALWVIKHHFYK